MTQTISLPLAAIVMALLCAGQGEGQFVFHRESVLGTSLELRVTPHTHATAGKAEARALAEIDRESKVLSGYDSGSEFSRWMKTRGEGVRVSEDLFEVLSRFDRYRALTSGALDASAQAVTRGVEVRGGGAPTAGTGGDRRGDRGGAWSELVTRSGPAYRDAPDRHATDSEFVHEELHCGESGRCRAGFARESPPWW